MIKRFVTILMLAGIVCAAPDIGITMREGGIVRADACVLAMDFETGIADDLSGAGNNGTVVGATFVAATGLSSGAVRFDGVDDVIDLPQDIFNFMQDTPHSYSFWLEIPSSFSSRATVIFPGDSDEWIEFDQGGDDKLAYHVYDGSSSRIYSLNVVNDDTWHHIVAIHNGSAALLYVDGIFQNSTSRGYPPETSRNSGIGADVGFMNNYLKGSIDEVLVYNTALTISEIKDLYRSGMIRHPNP